jgi:uncharacterized protein
MTVIVEKNVPVQLRDGTVLATDVYRPRQETRLPVLLQRTPYNKDNAVGSELIRMAQAGYAVVVQDARGRFASEGKFIPFVHEAVDGAETIEWAAQQPWSTGRIGTFGRSYVGATQWLAATQSPSALQAMAPDLTASNYYQGWTYEGGAFQLGFTLAWILSSLALGDIQRDIGSSRAGTADLADVVANLDNIEQLYWALPLTSLEVLARRAPYYFDWLHHSDYDEYWRGIAPHDLAPHMALPSLNIGGWYDIFINGTLANYRAMKAPSGTSITPSRHLIVGPWAHGVPRGMFPERHFGYAAGVDSIDLIGIQLRWFDRWLKHIDNGVDRERPVRIFTMGPNTWREEDDWPLPDTDFRKLYLHSRGHANSATGDGALTEHPPLREPEDVYLYDPRNPVPTVGGCTFLPGLWVAANSGPKDQRSVELRHDVLCYTTAPLQLPLEITGPVRLVLYVSSSARDTDFTGKVVDVAPDGRVEILSDGILRARFRDSMESPSLLRPGEMYCLQVELGSTSYVLLAGHRLRLEVSSSNFPRFDRNPNTGGVIAEAMESDLMPAVNRIHHDEESPSYLCVPVIDRATTAHIEGYVALE